MTKLEVVSYAKLPRIRHGKRYRGTRPVIRAMDFFTLQQRVRKLEEALEAKAAGK